jgi:glycosyltransferase involved in cell wall biosynthesis
MSTAQPQVTDDTPAERPLIHVQVCLLTFRRAELFKVALESLLAQTVLTSPVLFQNGGKCILADVALHILVVDNDAAQTARPIFDRALASSDTHMRYICEPVRGFSSARNRALVESGHMDYVAFLDDDEAAEPNWLARLLDASATYRADIATGPVEPRHIQSPEWVVRGRFFNPVSRATGERVFCVATNNVLLRGSIATSFRFDRRFDTGGEDTEFFMRIGRAGYKMIWVDDACVSECIPETRANMRWLLNRARGDASRYTRGCLSVNPGLKTASLRLLTACGGFLAGLILLPRSLFGRHYAVRALQLICRSIGTISALCGDQQSISGGLPQRVR